MPTNYRMLYAQKARLAIDAMGLPNVVNALRNHIGKFSSGDMTEDELKEAIEILDREINARLGERQTAWEKEWQAAEDRGNWNNDVEQRKADRQRRRNEKKVSG